MKKAPLLLSALSILASAGLSHGVAVTYTVASGSVLTISGNFGAPPSNPYGPQPGATSMVDTFGGSVTGDLVGTTLTFQAPTDAITAALNPSAPFAPAGAGVDNFGVTLLGGNIAFRDIVFNAASGVAQDGVASVANFAFTAGHADYNIPAFGAPGILPLTGNNANNSAAGVVTFATVGSTETVTIPMRLFFPGNASTPSTQFDGTLVLTRTIPEPTSFAFGLVGLLGIFRRRR